MRTRPARARRERRNEVLADAVAAEAAVAEEEVGIGRDREGWVRDDEPETLAVHGLEEASLPELDVVEPVQRAVELGEASARSLMSVATTVCACLAASTA